MELNEREQQELGRLIAEGNTSGRLDGEDDNGNSVYISWELKTNKWTDEERTDEEIEEDNNDLCNCGRNAGFHTKQNNCK